MLYAYLILANVALVACAISGCAALAKYGAPALDCGAVVVSEEVKAFADPVLDQGTDTAIKALRAALPVVGGLSCYLRSIAERRSQAGEVGAAAVPVDRMIHSRAMTCAANLRDGLSCGLSGAAALAMEPGR